MALLPYAVMVPKYVNPIARAVRDSGLFCAGERIGVAVSGGADSVALLLSLLELQKELGVILNVIHFNHKLRGRAADVDEKFVTKLAAKYGLTFYAAHCDVAGRARGEKRNLEDAARRSRYEFFAELVKAGKLDKIAVAHTADDQAETVLMHILRGAGLAGLGGIHPVADFVVRPLLGTRRAELRAYLRSRKQSWREDATNLDLTKTRARVRKKLLPLLEKQFQSAVVDHLCTLAASARQDMILLKSLVQEAYEKFVETSDRDLRIAASALADVAPAATITTEGTECTRETPRATQGIGARLVRRIVEQIKPCEGQLSAFHVNAVLDLAKSGRNGSLLELPGGVDVRREHDRLTFCVRQEARRRDPGAGSITFEYKIDAIDASPEIFVAELGCVFRLRVIDWPSKRGDTKRIESVLDRDALQFPLVLRNWRPGDKLHPFGYRGEQKLKRLLNKQHVSRWERDGWPVLTSGGRLAWARGLPVAAEFAVSDNTKVGVLLSEEPVRTDSAARMRARARTG